MHARIQLRVICEGSDQDDLRRPKRLVASPPSTKNALPPDSLGSIVLVGTGSSEQLLMLEKGPLRRVEVPQERHDLGFWDRGRPTNLAADFAANFGKQQRRRARVGPP